MSTGIRNLIFTADDFGSCDYIDNGIYEAIDQGVVTCVSAFINFKKRGSGAPGEAYMGSVAALKKLKDKHPHFPVGLHLTINTGTPAAKNNMVPNLIQDGPGTRYFKTIDQFSAQVLFTPHIVKEVGREVRAQLRKFRNNFGQPNHVSCHFGILFLFKNLLEEIMHDEGISGIPVRNPAMIFQTPNRERGNDRKILSKSMKFFEKNSKMKVEGAKKAKKWLLDSFDSAGGIITQGATKTGRLKLLMENDCHFPDYTLGSLYKRPTKDWEGGLAKYLGQIPTFIPRFYNKNKERKGGAVAEFICHLGKGTAPSSSPVGVNLKYFKGRNLELQRLVESKPILRTNSINMVDFGFLDPEGHV